MRGHLTPANYGTALAWILALPILYVISRYNYNLFHSLADGATIVIAASAFTIIWNSRQRLDNGYFLYVGIAFLFFAILDLIHMLGNKNMGVFPASYGNLGPTFYIASRYVLSISLLIAPFFIRRKLNTALLFAVYSAVTALIILSVFTWNIFPACFVEGVGLTPFKVISDYVICLILLGAIAMMFINRRAFDPRVLKIIVAAIILSIATGLTFTLYSDPFGITNTVGHLFQIASFYLIYLAFIETSLNKPQEILFRKLKLNEEQLTENLKRLDAANAELNQEIAERRRAEEELRRQREWLQVTLSSIGDAVIATDATGRITFMNAVAEALTGWTLTEASQKPVKEIFNIINEYTRHEVENPVAKVLQEGVITGLANHTLLVRKDGTEVPIDDSAAPIQEAGGKILGVILIFRDITERKRAEAALRESEQIYHNLFTNITEEVHFWNLVRDENGRIINWRLVDANPPTLVTWGRTIEEIKGKTTDEIFGPGASDHFMGVVRKITEEKVPFSFEDYFPHLEKYFRFTSVPLGEHFITTGFDITDIKKAQKLAEQNQLQLEMTNKELESFSYSVSHDLRAPLRAIKGYAQMILRKGSDRFDGETRRRFEMITTNAERMGQLIDDLLAFSRLGSQTVAKGSLDMEELIGEVWQELRDINPGREMSLKIGPMPAAWGDKALIRQVYGNLLGNTVKFTQGRNPAVIEAGTCTQDGETVYYVRDNGVGFDMRFYDRLFGVFQRLHSDEKYEGTGIGLALVKRIVIRHGGRIWAEGEEDKGATFYFTLPTQQEQ
jgi:PAS domain S-box-containing protein